MKVNENRHLGSSAFDPPLHRDSSFLYEVTGSNPSRAINSVHPRQAPVSVNTPKVQTQHPQRAGRSTTAVCKLVVLEQIHFNKHCLLVTNWIYL